MFSLHLGRILLLSGSASIALLATGAPGRAQTALPEVNVTVASPIVRHPPARPRRPAPTPAAAPATPAAAPPEPTVAAAPPPGALPIVTDQFATVTVVPNEEIRRNGAGTLGDLLVDKPGITGSSFAPGASSRPIIRGLDVNRVGIVENGVGGGGVSDLGEDHFVPIDPLVTDQVEVIRGPATLRYGSQSIGGVVSATDNRIPTALPERPFVLETRGQTTTVDRGLQGGMLLDAGADHFAFHADGFARHADDYAIPQYPYLFVPGRPFNGFQPNTSLHSEGGSVGGSYVFDRGFVGVAVMQNDSVYHIPGIDGEDHQTRIDAHQTKVMSKGEYRADSSFVDTVRFWAGATDYRHNELGLADPTDFGSDGVRQIFTNKEQEGRVEVTMVPVTLGIAELTTALGTQAGHQDLTAPSPDNPGLFDPNSNTRVAGYMFNEFKFPEGIRAQIAGRVEHVDLSGLFPSAPLPDLFAGADFDSTPRTPSFTPKSVAAGLLKDLPWDMVASVTAQYVERAPKPAELFSRGAHDATATFDIGNPDLKIESAKSIEVGLRRAPGPFRFEATAYYTRFNGFIFRQITDVLCSDTFATCGNGDPENENKLALYSQRDAIFRGAEFQSQLDMAPLWTGTWGIEDQFDVVRATFTDGTNVPRIPPVRVGGGLFWRDANWLMRVNLLHAFAHTNVEVTPTFVETPTAGYNNLRAEVSYRWKLNPATSGVSEMLLGVKGDNLLDDDIRNSVSYTKDEVLLPGRSVRLFANMRF
jgi:iron complex outermembrane receptor protein